MSKQKFLVGITVIAITIFSGLWFYSRATDGAISICVQNNGAVRVIGDEFRRDDCKKNETLLTWNIQGPKGDKGDKGDQGEQGPVGPRGEPGLPAQHGAGNVAFIFEDYLLKTDGTVWAAYRGNVPYTRILGNGDGVRNIPVPVSDIIDWQYSRLVDKSGNYWFINIGNIQGGWMNFGPLP